jgi:7-cyano-7-deazaguanine synthase
MKITTILSGGMDSATLLYYAFSKTINRNDLKVLSFNYGQKHKKELDCSIKLTKNLKVEHKIVDISNIRDLISASALTSDKEIPEGHYAKENMKLTVVPNRNAIMLSIAYGYAITNKSDVLYYGAHAGDHFIYPDCRIEFVKALDTAFYIGNLGFSTIDLIAPFSKKSKVDIVKLGLKLNIPYEDTWSCYKGEDRPCLKCGTCIERTEAFYINNCNDPLLTIKEWQQAIKNYREFKKEYEQNK